MTLLTFVLQCFHNYQHGEKRSLGLDFIKVADTEHIKEQKGLQKKEMKKKRIKMGNK